MKLMRNVIVNTSQKNTIVALFTNPNINNSRKSLVLNMANIKCNPCSKVCETIYGIIKHLSTYEIWQKTVYYIILHNILCKINHFLIAKLKTILPLAKSISKKKSPYTNIFNIKNMASIDKIILDRSKTVKIPEVKLITPENKQIISNC